MGTRVTADDLLRGLLASVVVDASLPPDVIMVIGRCISCQHPISNHI